jgi:hypothetical protein
LTVEIVEELNEEEHRLRKDWKGGIGRQRSAGGEKFVDVGKEAVVRLAEPFECVVDRFVQVIRAEHRSPTRSSAQPGLRGHDGERTG